MNLLPPRPAPRPIPRRPILVLKLAMLLAGIGAGIWLTRDLLMNPARTPIRIVTEVALPASDPLPKLQLYSITGELVGDSAVYNRAIFLLDEGRDLELRTDRVYGGWKLEIALAESYAVLQRGTERREYHYPVEGDHIPWLIRRLRYNPTRKHAYATLQQLGPRVKPYLREMLDSTATCSRAPEDYYIMDHLPDRECDLAALLIAAIESR